MNYYWFNRQEILQKAKEKYSKEKAAQNKEAIKESIKNWFSIKKSMKKQIIFCFFLNIKKV